MPCCYLTLKASKPCNKAYPRDVRTLGDHIRKRRLDLGIHQKDVAALVNATTSTVTNWEKGRSSPRLYLLPKVFEFLGYNPHQATQPALVRE
ncbi:MAG: helix-turn-helix transcriptional regulator [Ignavibacteria bacterium]|nr:helix-turn-helix transcriptional regulator [Ignavibacteria bacterium]